jgi:hypothetical protein
MSSNGRRDDEGGKRENGSDMIKVDAITLGALSELFINLSAAWFFAMFLVPFSQDLSIQTRIFLLTADLVFGIVCLGIGIKLRRLKKKYDT